MKQLIVLFALLLTSTTATSHSFTWVNLFFAHVKYQPNYNYKANVDAYMKAFQKEVWRKYSRDEFEIDAKRQEAIKEFKQRVGDFNLDEEFELLVSFEFEKYDFEKAEYPLKALSKDSYFQEKRPGLVYTRDLPPIIKVFFTNPEKIGNLKMGKEQAKTFLNTYKKASRTRQLPVRMYFKITGIHSEKYGVTAEITKAQALSLDQKTVIQEY